MEVKTIIVCMRKSIRPSQHGTQYVKTHSRKTHKTKKMRPVKVLAVIEERVNLRESKRSIVICDMDI